MSDARADWNSGSFKQLEESLKGRTLISSAYITSQTMLFISRRALMPQSPWSMISVMGINVS